MRIAIVHDWLNHKRGGAENVLLRLSKLFSDADIYTLAFNPDYFEEIQSRVVVSGLQKYPKKFRDNPKYLLPAIRKSIGKWKFDSYDLVISSSGAWSKNITLAPNQPHVCYCYTPARMLWDSWPKYLDQQFAPKSRIQPARLTLLKLCSELRLWDYYGSGDVTQFVAISDYVASRIHKFYGRESLVIYPPVEIGAYHPSKSVQKQDYFLVLSTLAPYKRVDIVVQSFAKSGLPLIIAGEGADRRRLENLASGAKNIEFRGYVDETQKTELLQQARALIFPGVEDFGIVPVEAMAAGTPVIALKRGGLLETVVAGKTGLFFEEPTSSSLTQAIRQFDKTSFMQPALFDQSSKFDGSIFDDKIIKLVKSYEPK